MPGPGIRSAGKQVPGYSSGGSGGEILDLQVCIIDPVSMLGLNKSPCRPASPSLYCKRFLNGI